MKFQVYLLFAAVLISQSVSAFDINAFKDLAHQAQANIERELTSRQFHSLVAIEEALSVRGFDQHSIHLDEQPKLRDVAQAVAHVFKSQSAVSADGSNYNQVYDETVIAPCEVVSSKSENVYSQIKSVQGHKLDAISDFLDDNSRYWLRYAYLCNEVILRDLRREVSLQLKSAN